MSVETSQFTPPPLRHVRLVIGERQIGKTTSIAMQFGFHCNGEKSADNSPSSFMFVATATHKKQLIQNILTDPNTHDAIIPSNDIKTIESTVTEYLSKNENRISMFVLIYVDDYPADKLPELIKLTKRMPFDVKWVVVAVT